MIINILLLIIIFLSLGIIAFIISRKFFSLINIDVEQIPREKMARIKKVLLEKKIIRQIEEWQNRLKARKENFKVHFKKIKKNLISKIDKVLIFLKNKIEFIKNKYEKIMPR